VFGLIPFGRHEDAMLGRQVDEVTYQSSYPGGPALTLIKYLDSTGPVAGEAVQGFMSDNLEALVERALAHGGTAPDPIREVPAYNLRVVFVLDPEGHVNEVIQMNA
jgi:predicted enzyme related to lactoylglutathione lyase